jgi:Bacterial RNA polymerase, alpha chain C terminal domain
MNPKDYKDISIESLELSIRSSDLLKSLGVNNLAELMALKNFTTDKLIIGELREVLEELDVPHEQLFGNLKKKA